MQTPLKHHQAALPLHLTLAMLPLLASNAALQLSKSGLAQLSLPAFPAKSENLQKLWHKMVSDPSLAQMAVEEAKRRASEFCEGVYKYKSTEYARDVEEPAAVFQLGNARLIDYGSEAQHSPVVFIVPSLINKYYILDLTQKLSFARYLSSQGIRVFLLDWQEPGEMEAYFNCGLYVTEILVPMAEHIVRITGEKIILGGYCMGGVLSLALAQIRKDLFKGLALFATPWNFMDPGFPLTAMQGGETGQFENYINACDEVPANVIQNIFHRANPYAYQNKLREFARMQADNPQLQEFLAIEHWVNDGVAMTKGVAQDCFIRWAQQNALANSQWYVGGQAINPRQLKLPVFNAVPLEDKIVPKGCALPLAQLLKSVTLVTPATGHIGMMVGRQRMNALWRPFQKWIYSQFT